MWCGITLLDLDLQTLHGKMVKRGIKLEHILALELYTDSVSFGKSIVTLLLKADSQICDAIA